VRLHDDGGKPRKIVRRFGAMTNDLRAMASWLIEEGVTHVAMESTGVYWKPVWNILEGQFTLVLANAQHVKNVPGRKTDMKDSEWLAELLQHGLLAGSFVPPRLIRDLRDLTRTRARLTQESSRIASRIQKVLEDANIKLASVASDALGKSGQAMLAALIAGQSNPGQLADLALGTLRGKIPQLRRALDGLIRDHHRFLLERLLVQWRFVENETELIDQRLEQIGKEEPEIAEAIARWDTVPGVDRIAAWGLVAEMGINMEQFPSARHAASWGGVCPGNHESAGKRLSGRTRKGNPWLRRILGQSAWAAARTKNTYVAVQFRRLAAKRGRKRAIVAIGHSLLITGYHLLRKQCMYQDLGPGYLDRINAEGLKRYLVKRLESLGQKVTLEPRESAA
jgi:Transposase and inactivated derivatives